MPHSEGLRFEVSVNGERRCIAGVPASGVVTVIVHCPPDDPSHIIVGGLAGEGPHWDWIPLEEIPVGTVARIRVLPPGEFDDPVRIKDYSDPQQPPRRSGRLRPHARSDPVPQDFRKQSLRLEVSIDGQERWLAGHDGPGSVSALLVWTANRPHELRERGWETTGMFQTPHLVGDTFLNITGTDFTTEESLTWVMGRHVNAGSEVLIRDLPPGEHDPAAERRPKYVRPVTRKWGRLRQKPVSS
ncbi:MAG: hypothetical protein ACK47B_13085 [Armatimonadota bacterium]